MQIERHTFLPFTMRLVEIEDGLLFITVLV